jgi:ubiquinol-cytochrome c reductase cytochrome b subunit
VNVQPRQERERSAVEFVDERLGAANATKAMLRYVFPDHWSFLLGEIALYCFVVLVGTGIFLALYYTPSDGQIVYHGTYSLLDGAPMSEAYRSVLQVSFNVPAGLLIRQVHHWAADVFIAAITLHLLRVFFTGAFRKPRDLNWYVGLTMLMLAILEGFLGYSLVDDLLSGMGLAIAYAVALSVPLIGGQLGVLMWGGQFPGNASFLARLEVLHVLLLPAALTVLITIHLGLIMRAHHTDFPGPGRRESNVVGTPMWPAYALRSIGLLLAVAGVLFLLGGLVQINPIWQWGPFHAYLSTNGAQPDWYIGWLIGALRLMPNFEPTIAGHTLIPNPFWGGVFFPLVVFGVLFAYPALERRLTGDRGAHHLLDRPRDHPVRTAFGAAFFSWVAVIFLVGSTDRIFYRLDISYSAQIHFWRAGVFVVPVIVFLLTRAACNSLRRRGGHPLRGWEGDLVVRRPDGSFAAVAEPGDRQAS